MLVLAVLLLQDICFFPTSLPDLTYKGHAPVNLTTLKLILPPFTPLASMRTSFSFLSFCNLSIIRCPSNVQAVRDLSTSKAYWQAHHSQRAPMFRQISNTSGPPLNFPPSLMKFRNGSEFGIPFCAFYFNFFNVFFIYDASLFAAIIPIASNQLISFKPRVEVLGRM